jgi:pseudouridine-5'-phosphate glycosidase
MWLITYSSDGRTVCELLQIEASLHLECGRTTTEHNPVPDQSATDEEDMKRMINFAFERLEARHHFIELAWMGVWY